MDKISNCCSVEDRAVSEDGPNWSDLCMCPECREPCEFVEEND